MPYSGMRRRLAAAFCCQGLNDRPWHPRVYGLANARRTLHNPTAQFRPDCTTRMHNPDNDRRRHVTARSSRPPLP